MWVRANDMGHTGVGGAMETVARFKVEVTAVNDAPEVFWRGVIMEPADDTTVSVDEDTDLLLDACCNDVRVVDPGHVVADGRDEGLRIDDVDGAFRVVFVVCRCHSVRGGPGYASDRSLPDRATIVSACDRPTAARGGARVRVSHGRVAGDDTACDGGEARAPKPNPENA